MKLNNITIDKFFKSGDISEYHMYMRWIKPKNLINGIEADFDNLTYSQVERIRELAYNPELENIIELYDIIYKLDAKKLLSCKVLELFQTNRFIVNYIKMINNKEKMLDANVSEKDKTKFKIAGGARLSMFKGMGTMIKLGKLFHKTPEEIGEWNYNTVYITLLYENISMDVQIKMSEIKD